MSSLSPFQRDDGAAGGGVLALGVFYEELEFGELLAVLLPLAHNRAAQGHGLVGYIHAAILAGELDDAAAVVQPVGE